MFWDGSETMAVARVDGRHGLNVLDRTSSATS